MFYVKELVDMFNKKKKKIGETGEKYCRKIPCLD